MHGPEVAYVPTPVSGPNQRERAFLKSLHRTAVMLEECLEAHEALFEAQYPARSCSSLTERIMRRRLDKLQLTIRRVESSHA
jgi:hypothetical protein